MEIIKLDFTKDTKNKTILTDQENIDKIVKYVLPIIEENEGWGTANLTKESFLKDPSHFQDEIDATIWKNVHILMDNENPIGLLEFGKSTIDEDKERHSILKALFKSENLEAFNDAMGKSINQANLPGMHNWLTNKPIYTAVGIVLKPKLQNKKTGYVDMLYKIISDGLFFGWTSNPIIIRKGKTNFKNTLFFPSFDEFPNTLEEWAVCLYVYAYIKSHNEADYKDLKFGTMRSPYFVEDRGDKYREIAKKMREQNKISEIDEKRINYILSKTSCAGAIVSWN